MPTGTNTKKAWFKKVFGGKTKTVDPAKATYEFKLNQLSPSIKQAAKVAAFKEAMVFSLKQIDKLVKDKQYAEATTQLEALGRRATNALAPKLDNEPNAKALQEISHELANVVGRARADRLVVLRPTLEQEEAVILRELENKNDLLARNYLQTLKYRLNNIKTHTVRITTELQRLYARAGMQSEGTQAEIDKLRDDVLKGLNNGDVTLADAALKEFQNWVREREGRIETILDGIDEVKQSISKDNLKLVPPANFDNDEKTIRDLMGQGKIAEAEAGLDKLRNALKPAAELHRLRQLLERLVEEETTQPRINKTLLTTQQKAAEGFLDAGDAKQAQSAIKKIQYAIANYEWNMKPEERSKISGDRIDRKLAARLKKAQELAGSNPPEDVKKLLEQMASLKPPHDAKSEAKSAELYTQILIKTNNGKIEVNPGLNLNRVFRLKTTDKVDIQGSKLKQFFKPVSGEKGAPGFPPGCGVSREVVGKVLGDKMSAMMGIEMNIPETNLIELPPELFPPDLANGSPVVGSTQHTVQRKGEAPQRTLDGLFTPIRRNKEAQKDLLAKISKKKAQGLQVFDLVFANLDRHAGNLFVKGEGEEAELSPIDNGMGLPSKQGLLLRGEGFGLHALQDMPANDDKFDPEVLAGIDKLDEEELAEAAKASFKDMQARFPNSEATKDEMLNDEHLELMKSSVRFLKQAAKELTVNELYNAYLVSLQDIY